MALRTSFLAAVACRARGDAPEPSSDACARAEPWRDEDQEANCAVGAVGTAILGTVLFGESANTGRLASLGLIVAGIVGLKLATPT